MPRSSSLERAHAFMQEHGTSFWEALWATRAGNVFTTHTPVATGFDAYALRPRRQVLSPLRRLRGRLGYLSRKHSWGWGVAIPTTPESPSTWPISPCAALRPSTA